MQILSKNGGSDQEIKKLIDLKVRLEVIRQKCHELKVEAQESEKMSSDSDDDDEMEEVPEKEGFEPVIPVHLRTEYGKECSYCIATSPQNCRLVISEISGYIFIAACLSVCQ